MRKLVVLSFAAVLVLAAAGPVSAGIILHNGGPNLASSLWSDFDTPQQAADDFTTRLDIVIRDVHWWGAYSFDNTPPDADDFTIRIFPWDGNAGAPDLFPTILDLNVGHVNRTDTGLVEQNQWNIYKYDVAIPGLALSGGTYALSIVNNTVNEGDDWVWQATDQAGTGTWHRSNDFQTSWNTNSRNQAFYLTNDIVPEPATLSLLALGGLGLLRRRRRR